MKTSQKIWLFFALVLSSPLLCVLSLPVVLPVF